MDNNQALSVTCDFNGFLVCQIPKNTVKVELKIKTTRGKYTLNKDTYTRTERYHPWNRANRRAQIHTKKRTPRREAVNMDTPVDSTNSKTDIEDGEGFAYAPKVFTNPEYAAIVPQTETEGSDLGVVHSNFIGEYCKKCIKKYNRCWCDKLDWDEDLMEVEPPKGPTNQNISKTNNTKQPNSLTLVSIRQPSPGWLEFRRGVINKSSNAQMDNEMDNVIQRMKTHLDRIIIRGIRSISTKEFEEM